MLFTCTSKVTDWLFPICKTGSAALDPARNVVFDLSGKVAVVMITVLPNHSFPEAFRGKGFAEQLWVPVIPRASIVALVSPVAIAADHALKIWAQMSEPGNAFASQETPSVTVPLVLLAMTGCPGVYSWPERRVVNAITMLTNALIFNSLAVLF